MGCKYIHCCYMDVAASQLHNGTSCYNETEGTMVVEERQGQENQVQDGVLSQNPQSAAQRKQLCMHGIYTYHIHDAWRLGSLGL
jgi:hypothetical protein